MIRRFREAAERFAARRKREDEAPRLLTIAPNLDSLKLEVQERRAGSALAEATHIRRIVVASAPALFELTCHDSSCKEGGHDVTNEIIGALRSGRQRFEGEHACSGQVGSAECSRVMHYVGTATYRA